MTFFSIFLKLSFASFSSRLFRLPPAVLGLSIVFGEDKSLLKSFGNMIFKGLTGGVLPWRRLFRIGLEFFLRGEEKGE